MTVREEIARTLDYIDAAQRDTWIRVGNAIKTELGDEGFDLWDGWSSSAPNYEQGGMKAQWRSLRAGKVTLASLYYLAGENDYHRGSPSASDPYTRPIRSPKREIIDDSPLRAAETALLARKVIAGAAYEAHAYLGRKGFPERRVLVNPKDVWVGKRLAVRAGEMLVPVRDIKDRRVISLQAIAPDGRKRFLKGGRIRGGCFTLGRGKEVWVCEGYATALSVLEALHVLYRDARVLVVFSANGMKALTPRRARVIADNDPYLCQVCRSKWRNSYLPDKPKCPYCGSSRTTNPAGAFAAIATGQSWWMVPDPGDANDFHVRHGINILAGVMAEKFLTGKETKHGKKE